MISNKDTKKTVRTFALASFLNNLGSDMIYPIWPLFVTSVLGVPMTVLGFLDGLGDALVSISQAFSGYLSDRFKKRKPFIWLGYLFGGLSRIGYALSSYWQLLIPFRILDRAGKMRGAPRDAMIADASTQANRGKNFGIIRAMDNLGAVCGIIVCIIFFNVLGYRNLFLLASIPSLISLLLIIFFIKEKKLPDTKIYKGLALKDIDRNFKLPSFPYYI
ncbi:MAG: MFS transporter [bacterium]|nr:MFS transporter [bacterium]